MMKMTLNERHKIIIIGAGAAGLMAAVSACRSLTERSCKPDVLILEGNDSAGKKITATGNGKCNFTNLMQLEGCYRSTDPELVPDIINEFDEQQTIRFFEKIGVLCYERDGYCYPLSEQAKSIRDALEYKVFKSGARIHYNMDVTDIIPLSVTDSISYSDADGIYHQNSSDDISARFRIICNNADDKAYEAETLIISTGGNAAPVFGTDGRMFNIINKLNIPCIKRLPALCGLKLSDAFIRQLDGVRVRCLVSLYNFNESRKEKLSDDDKAYSEHGEIIFNKNGVSGIPILNLSRFAVSALDSGLSSEIHIDFFPSDTDTELFDYLFGIISESKMSPLKCFCGIMNDKLLRLMLSTAGFKPEEKPDFSNIDLLRNRLSCLVSFLKNFSLTVSGYLDYDNAQTTQGGVSLRSVDSHMQSKNNPGLYFAGEVLDVDGKCGGYNLQWAWSTGYIAGKYGGSYDQS